MTNMKLIITICSVCLLLVILLITICVFQYEKQKHVKKNAKNKLYPVIYNISQNKQQQSENRVIVGQTSYIYIHVCMIGIWEEVITKLLNTCKQAGLLKQVQKCYMIALGNKSQLVNLNDIIKNYDNCEIKTHQSDVTNYERTTLNILWDDANIKDHNFKVLYLHSKGVTRNKNREIACVSDWVDYMSHYLINHHQLCQQALNTFDTVGVNFKFDPQPHFSGNFWWANSKYIKTLPRYIGQNYLDPEMWICSLVESRILCLAQSNVDHYKQRYQFDSYQHKTIDMVSNKDNIIFDQDNPVLNKLDKNDDKNNLILHKSE
jgi:hypothetical protein